MLTSASRQISLSVAFSLSGYWAEDCDRRILPAMEEPVLPAFFGHIVVYLLVISMIILVYFLFSRRRQKQPPPYEQATNHTPPPPYYLI
ncbi:unnamed protein product [Nippostrongylus brasiliensis]|uniref:Uncharacterized protein n=1 Tax=Nippostrongylus brasiliensis TaxID=27835 RepID=A0A0N4YE69_NIPBR|nr:unnamed protein product [Nippostrongylus brasiliensis]